jgi:hypothetical protein
MTISAVPPPHSSSFRIQYKRNEIKDAIENNNPIDSLLHVVCVISNPCSFRRRYHLTREFMRRMEFENNVVLYVVELAYGSQPFVVTSSRHPRHLQLRTSVPLWHKENMVNLGIRRLLPPDWKAVAWIDADIDFENADWAMDCLKILNGCRDVVQLFSHALDMDRNEEVLNIFNSFSFRSERELPYHLSKSNNYWHPGYAWACHRRAYDTMGGLFDQAILGSGDFIMSSCFINRGSVCVHTDYSPEYKALILNWQSRVRRLRLGYVPGVIRHFFHGSKINRRYVERNQILLRHGFVPSMISYNADGILVPSSEFSSFLESDILNYFQQRLEDD